MTPIVAFATFAVYRALNGSLDIPKVFYALSLLALPRLYMVQFFIFAVQSITELWVSLKRIDAFLASEEPPRPTHGTPQHGMPQGKTGGSGRGDGASVMSTRHHEPVEDEEDSD